jgi:hypothetical protein
MLTPKQLLHSTISRLQEHEDEWREGWRRELAGWVAYLARYQRPPAPLRTLGGPWSKARKLAPPLFDFSRYETLADALRALSLQNELQTMLHDALWNWATQQAEAIAQEQGTTLAALLGEPESTPNELLFFSLDEETDGLVSGHVIDLSLLYWDESLSWNPEHLAHEGEFNARRLRRQEERSARPH